MKAVVLVGGFGTRLRPLTETVKKELLPLVDRPILDHTLDRLVQHGVREVIMSSPYLEEAFGPFIAARAGEPAITWVTEERPLGTGGAVVRTLDVVGSDPFFALNGDICTDLDLTAMRAFHDERGASVTIALHHVEDARAFGLVQTEEDGRVVAFREKPTDAVAGDINAGTYLLDPAVLGAFPAGEEISIERTIFPEVIAAGHPVYGFGADGYWIDLGTPEKYLQAHADLLAGRVRGISYDAPWIHPSAEVDPSARLDAAVAVGAEARVGRGARVERSVLHAGAFIGAQAVVLGSVVGAEARVGAGARVSDSVLGAGARVPDHGVLEGARVSVDADVAPG
ncbi:MAG: NDP-sugar synthase [Actinomycetota bacterium]